MGEGGKPSVESPAVRCKTKKQTKSVKNLVENIEANKVIPDCEKVKEMTPVRKMLKSKLKNVTKLKEKKMTSAKSKELNFTQDDKKSELLSLEVVEENSEVVVISDMLRTSQSKIQEIPSDYGQSYRPKIAHERGMGARKETRTEVTLRNTARKLNLKKITSMFEQVPVGESKTQSRNTYIQKTSDMNGVSWGGEMCTVQTESSNCDSQSEVQEQGGAKRHLGFGARMDCDWAGEFEKGNETEDVIGSSSQREGISANQRGEI
jgi:hypothetical protein